MLSDQEWCLECGAARTVIATTPRWGLAVGAIACVVVLVAGSFLLAVMKLSRSAGQQIVEVRQPKPTNGLATWPPGSDGYTVLLKYTVGRTAAEDAARALPFKDVGVLATSQHPGIKPTNVFYVFVGRFATLQEAQKERDVLSRSGQPEARASLVQRPGGP
jgi:hypothetical protein